MTTCKACGKPFNLGFQMESGDVCILCADGKSKLPFLSDGENRYIREYYERGAEYDAYTETPKALASRLLKMVLYYLLFPVIAFALAFALTFIHPVFYYIILSLAAFVEIFLALKWLSVLNSVMEVNDTKNLALHLTISFFIPLYGIILTFMERSKIMQLPAGEIRYGRLRIV